jgi:RNA polymerase sigma-70 factor (ECF subfamily)
MPHHVRLARRLLFPDAMGDDRRQLEGAISQAIAEGRLADATTCALNAYSDEIRRYLARFLRNDDDAAEAFARFAERVWRGIAQFKGRSSFRTWAYCVARRCACDVRRRPNVQRLDTEDASRLAHPAPSSLPVWQRPTAAGRFARMRAQLRSEEQTLLELRLDKGLPWKQVARALGQADSSEAALRQRFEWLKGKLRRMAQEHG